MQVCFCGSTSGLYFNFGRYEVKCPRRKQHDGVTTGSTAQDTGGHYSSQLLGLYNGPSDMINPENAWPSASVDLRIAVSEINEGEVPRIPCFVTELAEILQRLVKMGVQSAALQLVEVLHDQMLYLDIFKRIIKYLKDSEEVSCKSTKENIKDDGFKRVLMRDGGRNKKGHGIL